MDTLQRTITESRAVLSEDVVLEVGFDRATFESVVQSGKDEPETPVKEPPTPAKPDTKPDTEPPATPAPGPDEQPDGTPCEPGRCPW